MNKENCFVVSERHHSIPEGSIQNIDRSRNPFGGFNVNRRQHRNAESSHMLGQPSGAGEDLEKERSMSENLFAISWNFIPRRPQRCSGCHVLQRLRSRALQNLFIRARRRRALPIPGRRGTRLQGSTDRCSVVPVPRVAFATLDTDVLALALITETTST